MVKLYFGRLQNWFNEVRRKLYPIYKILNDLKYCTYITESFLLKIYDSFYAQICFVITTARPSKTQFCINIYTDSLAIMQQQCFCVQCMGKYEKF